MIKNIKLISILAMALAVIAMCGYFRRKPAPISSSLHVNSQNLRPINDRLLSKAVHQHVKITEIWTENSISPPQYIVVQFEENRSLNSKGTNSRKLIPAPLLIEPSVPPTDQNEHEKKKVFVLVSQISIPTPDHTFNYSDKEVVKAFQTPTKILSSRSFNNPEDIKLFAIKDRWLDPVDELFFTINSTFSIVANYSEKSHTLEGHVWIHTLASLKSPRFYFFATDFSDPSRMSEVFQALGYHTLRPMHKEEDRGNRVKLQNSDKLKQ